MPFSSIPTHHNPYAAEQDKLLFTPGPLTTSFATKFAALNDLGSRDGKFIAIVQEVRQKLLDIAGVSNQDFTTILMQGSGTFGVESVITSTVNGTLLVVANGSYGKRMTMMAAQAAIPFVLLECPEDEYPSQEDVARLLREDTEGKITHVAMVQSETTAGIVNDVNAMGAVVAGSGRSFIVDAMSCFGAVPLSFAHVDFMVSSANKCLEGIPGFSYIIARKAALDATPRKASSLSLDVKGQVTGLDKDGQFRWTPPTHAILAFRQAMDEYEQEGGLEGRAARYQANQRTLQAGMDKLGFSLYLPKERQGYIISSYRYPTDANWDFNRFYNLINDRGFAIYPGKVSNADCFRIGHIGRLFPEDTQRLVDAMDEVCREMQTAKYAA